MKNRMLITDANGFTMIEVIVAALILTVGVLGTAAALGGVIQGNGKSREMIGAVHLAKDKMEDIRWQGYPGTPAVDTQAVENYNTISGFGSYKRLATIDVDNPTAGMKFVTVKVSWKGDKSSYELNTILAR
jgi:prepilin-type N-terminal cleavage/methylation domain-containing protein